MGQGSFTPVPDAACAALGELASLLGEGRPLPECLRSLATGLALRSVVLRSAAGDVLGVGGEALQAVSSARAAGDRDVRLELPVTGPDHLLLATLTVRGGRPSQLPTLRTAAAILGLALSSAGPAASPAGAAEDNELGLDEIADALHDGPLQSLMVARYAVDAAARGGDPGAVRESVQQAVVELRRLVWSLRPRGDKGLAAALGQLSTSFVTAHELPLELSLGEGDPTGPVATLAYRLVQAVHDRALDRPVRVSLDGSVLDIVGAPLPSPQRWVRRASALGCVLTTNGDQTRLVLAAASISPISTDVRTTS